MAKQTGEEFARAQSTLLGFHLQQQLAAVAHRAVMPPAGRF
jgi:hypothetical protein